MARWTQKDPKLRLHRPSGRAVVTLSGKDFYLGRYGTKEAETNYRVKIAEWKNNHRVPPNTVDLTINEILDGYLRYAESYYVKNGKPTTQYGIIVQAIKPLRELYGHTEANEFTPQMLDVVRDEFKKVRLRRNPSLGLTRGVVNQKIRVIVRIFRWDAGRNQIHATTWYALNAFEKEFRLAKGRSPFRETKSVLPVERAHVDAIKNYVTPQIWGLIELQWHSAARPGEATIIRTCDIDMTGPVWVYTPHTHKTEHHDLERYIPLNRSAQKILSPFLKPNEPETYLFSPREAVAARHPNPKRRRPRPYSKKFNACYTVVSYNRAIHKGVDRANSDRAKNGMPQIPAWNPHRLRHSAATRIENVLSTEDARAVLGHRSQKTTEIYIKRDLKRALAAMAQIDN